jgi:hypothetical protein
MWIWPVAKFWTFTPYAWVWAVAWNISEILGVRLPFAGYAFGIIMGHKGARIR